MAKPGMMVYFTLTPAIKALPLEQRGMLFTAMLDYSEKQTEPDLPEELQFAWAFVKATLDADNARYEEIGAKRRAAAEERWRGKSSNDANACKSTQEQQKDASDANTNQIKSNQTNTNQNKKIENSRAKPAEPSVSDVFLRYAGEDAHLMEALTEFATMRKKLRKPLTSSTAQRLLRKLDSFPEGERIEVLFQSCDHCWQDIYALKTDENSKKGAENGKSNNNKWDLPPLPGVRRV